MNILKDYAFKLVGTPYVWAGDDPMKGFDCSGLVIELLKSTGLLPPKFDTTAQGLFNKFIQNGEGSIAGFGSLVFFGKSTNKITHIGFMLDSYRMLEAGGGGSRTLTEADAIKHNAFVRIRPIYTRGDLVAIIKPRYSKLKPLDN